jgi:hypothetical protein
LAHLIPALRPGGRLPEEIRTGDGAITFGARQAAEAFLSHANTRAIEAACLLMIDFLDLEMLMRGYPMLPLHGHANPSLRGAKRE